MTNTSLSLREELDAGTLTGQDVVLIAKSRGFQVLLNPGPPPMPFLRGDKQNATEALLEALKAYREEIIEQLAKDAHEKQG